MTEKRPTSVVGTEGGEPVAVVVEEEQPSLAESQRQAAEATEDALRSLGQRNVSLIWESTQQKLALSVMWSALAVALVASIFGNWLGLSPEMQLASAMFVYGIANLITGFYFGRTNHQRVGGPGGDDAGTR